MDTKVFLLFFQIHLELPSSKAQHSWGHKSKCHSWEAETETVERAEWTKGRSVEKKFEELNKSLEKKKRVKLLLRVYQQKKKLKTYYNNQILYRAHLNQWKKPAKVLLAMCGSTYACKGLISPLNIIKSRERNRLRKEKFATCVTIKAVIYLLRD